MTFTEHLRPVPDRKLSAVLFAVLLVLASSASAWPTDHLVPWPKPQEFRDENSTIFVDSFGPRMRLFGTLDAPMDARVAVSMEVEEGRYTIVTWAVKHGHNSGRADCEFGISATLGQKIDKVWATMIDGARNDDPEIVAVDGLLFYFARSYGGKLNVATAWTPESGEPAALADIFSAMSNLCLKPAKTSLDRLSRQANDLLAKLHKDQ